MPAARGHETIRTAGEARLRYMPGLDGLRALAVAAVFAYHAGLGWAKGGFLGVDMFFVLSGFLITSLLLTEWRRTGSLRVLRFWGRRALRLLPAVIVLLATMSVAVPLLAPDEGYRLRGDVLAGLGYVGNWRLIFEQHSYFQEIGRPPVLQHLWSLAVEEQFYLLWPLVLFVLLIPVSRARRETGRLVWPVLALAALSAGLMAVLYRPDVDPSRVYFGTDTRVAAILVGAALACRPLRWTDSGPLGARRRLALESVGIAALVGLASCVVKVDTFDPALYRGGFVAVAVLAAVAVAVVSHPRSWVGATLGTAPMTWLGRRSYAVYLWFWPVLTMTRAHSDVPLTGRPLLALQVALTLALAAASYRWVERPVRAGALARVWREGRAWAARRARPSRVTSRWVLAMALAALALGGSAILTYPPDAPPFEVAASVEGLRSATSFSASPAAAVDALAVQPPLAPAQAAPAPPPVATEPAAPPPSTDVAAPAQAPAAEATPPAPVGPPPGTRVTAIGESVLLEARPTLEAEIAGIDVVAEVGRQAPASVAAAAQLRDAGQLGDEVVVHIGNNGIVRPEALDELLSVLSGARRVAVLTVKVPRPWEEPNNAAIAEAVPRYPNAVLLDWKALGDANPGAFEDDGVHMNPDGVRLYVDLLRSGL